MIQEAVLIFVNFIKKLKQSGLVGIRRIVGAGETALEAVRVANFVQDLLPVPRSKNRRLHRNSNFVYLQVY